MMAAKVDANQGEIVDALRGHYCSVALLHRVGGGVPDLLVGYQGRNILMEVKDGAKPASQQKLTGPQVEFHAAWRGANIHIVRNTEEALNAAGVQRG